MNQHIKEPQKKFYFTFPYKNTYIIVMAGTEREAVEKFRAKFPDRHENTVNCAFWYSEEEWRRSLNEAVCGEPAEVIA